VVDTVAAAGAGAAHQVHLAATGSDVVGTPRLRLPRPPDQGRAYRRAGPSASGARPTAAALHRRYQLLAAFQHPLLDGGADGTDHVGVPPGPRWTDADVRIHREFRTGDYHIGGPAALIGDGGVGAVDTPRLRTRTHTGGS